MSPTRATSPGRSYRSVTLCLLAGLLVLASPTAGAAVPGPAPAPTPAERADLAGGDIVVRVQDDGWTVAFVEVAAPPDAVLDAVLDFSARSGDVGSIKDVEVYLSEGDRRGVRWDLSVAGVKIRFHTIYEIDRSAGRTTYVLDESRDNDIGDTAGAYTVLDGGDGRSLLVYQARSDSKAPDWLRKMLTQRSSRDMLGGMRDRAQRR